MSGVVYVLNSKLLIHYGFKNYCLLLGVARGILLQFCVELFTLAQ